MTALPIVQRELLVRARKARTQWMRVLVGGVAALFVLQFFLYGVRGPGLSTQSPLVFNMLSWLGFLLVCLGALLTADCISSERREGTLGLLLLARVRVFDVVAGKLTSHGIWAFYALVALTPALMIPLLGGGVKGGEVLRVVLVLSNTLFVALCAGVWVSTKARTSGQALMRGGAVMVLLIGLPWVAHSLALPFLSSEVNLVSPVTTLLLADAVDYGRTPTSYWQSLALVNVEGWLFLLLASRSMARSLSIDHRDVSGGHDLLSGGRVQSRKALPLLDGNPVCWLIRRGQAQVWLLWAAVLLLIGLRGLQWLLPRWLGTGSVGLLAAGNMVLVLGAAVLFAYAAARFFLKARSNGALEFLTATPRGARDLVSGQWQTLRGRLMGPLSVLVGVGLLWFAATILASAPRGMSGWPAMSGWVLLWHGMSLIGQVLHVFALCWLGLWFGLRARNAIFAVLWPVGLVVGLDVVITYGLWAVGSLLLSTMTSAGSFASPYVLHSLVIPLIIFAKQIWLILWARNRLARTNAGRGLDPIDPGSWLRETVRKARHWTPGTREGGGERAGEEVKRGGGGQE